MAIVDVPMYYNRWLRNINGTYFEDFKEKNKINNELNCIICPKFLLPNIKPIKLIYSPAPANLKCNQSCLLISFPSLIISKPIPR